MKVMGIVTRIQERENGRRIVWVEGLSLLADHGVELPRVGTDIVANVSVYWKGKRPILFLVGWKEQDGYRP